MRPSRLMLPLCLLALAAAPALASRTIVPDQHPTIQLGVDSGVDTVLVRPGEYPEVVTITRSVMVIGMVPDGPYSVPSHQGPAIGSVLSSGTFEGRFGLQSVRVRGAAVLARNAGSAASDIVLARECRFDSGVLAGGNLSQDVILNCLVFGDLTLNGFRGEIGSNTVIGGTISMPYANAIVHVHDNVVLGPSPAGIVARNDYEVQDNYVRGCDVGILVATGGGSIESTLRRNLIEDCGSDGIRYALLPEFSPRGTPRHNLIRRSGARGISLLSGFVYADSNVVEDAGTEGFYGGPGTAMRLRGNRVLRTGGVGILADLVFASDMEGNLVLHAGSDGIRVNLAVPMRRNIVGRSQGRGFVITGTPESKLAQNTSFMNSGAGFDVNNVASSADSITNNISYGNAVGLAWSGPSTPFLGCNDWFANSGGAVTGTAVGSTDVAVDPQFCDLPNDIVSLAAGSPLANLAGCGQVGALGVACAVAVGVGDQRPATLGRLRIQPQPSQGAMSFAFDASDAATTLEVYDVTGARRMARTLAPRTAGYAWNGTDDAGQPLPAGVYFAKLVQSAARSEATVVVIR